MKRLFRDSWSRIASTSAALIAVIALLAPCAAQATPYVVRFTQQGNNVVAIGSGEFSLTGVTFSQSGVTRSNAVGPYVGYVGTGPDDSPLDFYGGISGPESFGSGWSTHATTGTGNFVGLIPHLGDIERAAGVIFVPQGYVSGTALANKSVWINATATSLGITPGIYTWTWGSAADQSFTLDAFTAVPEPAALGMFGFGLLLLGGFLTLRGRQTGSAC